MGTCFSSHSYQENTQSIDNMDLKPIVILYPKQSRLSQNQSRKEDSSENVLNDIYDSYQSCWYPTTSRNASKSNDTVYTTRSNTRSDRTDSILSNTNSLPDSLSRSSYYHKQQQKKFLHSNMDPTLTRIQQTGLVHSAFVVLPKSKSQTLPRSVADDSLYSYN